MKRLLALTLFALLAISCSRGNSGVSHWSKGSNLTSSVGTQAELDAANRRVAEFKQELLRQGFHEVSTSFYDKTVDTSLSNSKEESVLEGQHGRLRDLRVNLWTTKVLQKDQPQLGGGIHASISDDQADREFEEFYNRVVFVVTGHAQ
jgi:CRISPR/Cas system-associated protein endoribonuclease Cas2